MRGGSGEGGFEGVVATAAAAVSAAVAAVAVTPKWGSAAGIKLYRVENYADRRQDGH